MISLCQRAKALPDALRIFTRFFLVVCPRLPPRNYKLYIRDSRKYNTRVMISAAKIAMPAGPSGM
jgi:hypothetical protein